MQVVVTIRLYGYMDTINKRKRDEIIKKFLMLKKRDGWNELLWLVIHITWYKIWSINIISCYCWSARNRTVVHVHGKRKNTHCWSLLYKSWLQSKRLFLKINLEDAGFPYLEYCACVLLLHISITGIAR